MPIVNVFYQDKSQYERVNGASVEIKARIAKELTCGNIRLDPSQISLRLIKSRGSGMIAELEVEITAHAFVERIDRQDEICLSIREHLLSIVSEVTDIRVWLLLPQLGHSWE